jgi:HEPN domain-containing protein
MNRRDLQNLARVRLAEAKTLLGAAQYDGAYYLAGYAVECALKACFARAVERHSFPDLERVRKSYTHKITELVKLARLEPERVSIEAANPAFALNWSIVKDWNEISRYALHPEDEARSLYAAITNRPDGILTWIRRHW